MYIISLETTCKNTVRELAPGELTLWVERMARLSFSNFSLNVIFASLQFNCEIKRD